MLGHLPQKLHAVRPNRKSDFDLLLSDFEEKTVLKSDIWVEGSMDESLVEVQEEGFLIEVGCGELQPVFLQLLGR